MLLENLLEELDKSLPTNNQSKSVKNKIDKTSKPKPSKFIATQKFERVGKGKTVDIEIQNDGLRIRKASKYSQVASFDFYPKQDAITLAKLIIRKWGQTNAT